MASASAFGIIPQQATYCCTASLVPILRCVGRQSPHQRGVSKAPLKSPCCRISPPRQVISKVGRSICLFSGSAACRYEVFRTATLGKSTPHLAQWIHRLTRVWTEWTHAYSSGSHYRWDCLALESPNRTCTPYLSDGAFFSPATKVANVKVWW